MPFDHDLTLSFPLFLPECRRCSLSHVVCFGMVSVKFPPEYTGPSTFGRSNRNPMNGCNVLLAEAFVQII